MQYSSCYPCHCSFLPIMVSSFQNSTTDRKLVSPRPQRRAVIHRKTLGTTDLTCSPTRKRETPMGRTRLEHTIEYLRGTENRYLIFAEGGRAQAFAPDTPEWFAWLATLPSFHFQGKSGQFSARQERKRRGTTY